MTPSSLLLVVLTAIVGNARTSTGFVAPVPSVVVVSSSGSRHHHPRSLPSSSSSSSSSPYSSTTGLGSHKLVLVRHGESTANLANVFTGWLDVALMQALLHDPAE